MILGARHILLLIIIALCHKLQCDCRLDRITVSVDGEGVIEETTADDEVNCPVCVRVIRAAREMGRQRQEDVTTLLNSYCAVNSLEVADQKFCYNTENVRGELSRMLKLGADEYRICKKVRSMNPDFCRVMALKHNKEGVIKNDRLVHGVIYE